MTDKRQPQKPTTPEEEGIELHDDAWQRFERTATEVGHYRPNRETVEPAGANRTKKRSADSQPLCSAFLTKIMVFPNYSELAAEPNLSVGRIGRITAGLLDFSGAEFLPWPGQSGQTSNAAWINREPSICDDAAR
jgi:hypothetical protein